MSKLTRIQAIDAALDAGTKLRFDYKPLRKGRRAIEPRTVEPLSISQSSDGRMVLLGEAEERDGAVRSFRVDRMFHVNTTA